MSTEVETEKQVSVQEMDAMVKELFELRAEIEAKESVIKELNKTLAKKQGEFTACLKALGRENYKSDHGTVSVVQKWRVSVPQTEEAKQAFFAHLKERGVLWQYATVNSNSLNSLFMADWEAAQERGEGMEFKMPGVSEPKLFETISMRKK